MKSRSEPHALRRAAIGLAVCVLASSAPALAKPVKLTGAEIRQTHGGHTFRFTWQGRSGVIRYSQSGGARATLDDGGSSSGKWWVEGDRLCTRFDTRDRKVTCGVVHRDGSVFSTPGMGRATRIK